ncbi:hypothetical protein L914_21552 [Phytophthora nicotianae]|uniref:Uncharacterized protein n=1 Tax=Phytophthora nicotianae TaxID=4792 RepID=W2M5D6_PHYNI|nr:hypothetical protein L914_21552 [Phytophthora nicotianae]
MTTIKRHLPARALARRLKMTTRTPTRMTKTEKTTVTKSSTQKTTAATRTTLGTSTSCDSSRSALLVESYAPAIP